MAPPLAVSGKHNAGTKSFNLSTLRQMRHKIKLMTTYSNIVFLIYIFIPMSVIPCSFGAMMLIMSILTGLSAPIVTLQSASEL